MHLHSTVHVWTVWSEYIPFMQAIFIQEDMNLSTRLGITCTQLAIDANMKKYTWKLSQA